MNAAEIQLALAKLNVLGRVLYVAAHPDDENTSLISYWANGALYDTAYLSLTRGDGGQNLIGPELREALGVIRTQELLAARRVDHGKQFFTRANDFGFSKSAEETLRIWDRDKILADVVWVIRQYRPDVIVTRFSADDNKTHGHHTASAQLAVEAFSAANDPKRFPEQLAYVKIWQAKRIVWNTSSFFFQGRNEAFDAKGLVSQEIGGYQPFLGKSFTEIAAASRSMHKSQGFGSGSERGPVKAFFKYTAGEPMEKGIFDAVDATWNRVPDGAALAEKFRATLTAFSPGNPSASVPALLEIRRTLQLLATSDDWAAAKLTELEGVIAACLGLRLEAVTDQPFMHSGEPLKIQVETTNRAPVAVTLRALHLPATDETIDDNAALAEGQPYVKQIRPTLPGSMPYSQPYWLVQAGTTGTFNVTDQTFIGRPENLPSFPVEVKLDVAGQEIAYAVQPRYRRVDPVAGETSEPLVLAPPVFVQVPRPVFVFGDAAPKTVEVHALAASANFDGTLYLDTDAGWRAEPASAPVHLRGENAEATVTFTITPLPEAVHAIKAKLSLVLESDDGKRTWAFGSQRIRYPHLEPQMLIPKAEARLVRADIQSLARTVGYLPGAGDAVPESLREIGVDVKVLDFGNVRAEDLARYDAIVLGVRAYNVETVRFTAAMPALRAYAEKGGVVIVQYNTMPGPGGPGTLPFPLHVSHDRVTDETAAVRILAPDHPLLNSPNKITAADFDGWVQERGLYFPDQWDPAWQPIISCNDPGEKPLDSGLLVARCGKGYFIYTGYSWFRELPAGVPGAYRIFANMISLGKQP